MTIQAQFLDDMWRTVRRANSAVLLMTQDLGIIAILLRPRDRAGSRPGGRQQQPHVNCSQRPPTPTAGPFCRCATPVPPAGVRTAPLLSVKGLRKTFALPAGKTLAGIDDLSFEIGRSETLGLVGRERLGQRRPSGAAYCGCWSPTRGRLTFEGEDVTQASPAEMRRLRRRRMQVVFQDPFDQLDPRWTVAKILSEALDKPSPARVATLLETVGLPPSSATQQSPARSVPARSSG